LIGATTENPGFEVNKALLSRCQVYILNLLSIETLKKIVYNALENDVILKTQKVEIKEWESLLLHSSGDARKLLNVLEIVVNSHSWAETLTINNTYVDSVLQKNTMTYDKNGENHYDVISAFIKSIRGSHTDAALYWLARMLESGEDPIFIARRILISAAEDIGLANPNAILIANSCFDAVQNLGMPEARIPLSQAVIYLSTSPKSNTAYNAINEAISFVKKTGNLSVPLHLRNAANSVLKDLDYGKAYLYPHNYEENFVKQSYLPQEIDKIKFWNAGNNPREKEMQNLQDKRWNK
jgi:putative ATPase